MGSQKCRIVGKSQSVRIMINHIISTRTRMHAFMSCMYVCMYSCAPCLRPLLSGDAMGAGGWQTRSAHKGIYRSKCPRSTRTSARFCRPLCRPAIGFTTEGTAQPRSSITRGLAKEAIAPAASTLTRARQTGTCHTMSCKRAGCGCRGAAPAAHGSGPTGRTTTGMTVQASQSATCRPAAHSSGTPKSSRASGHLELRL
jgi:hypothetical protein